MKRHNNLTRGYLSRNRRCLTELHILHFAGFSKEDTMTKTEAIYAKYERFEEQLAHCYFRLHERFISNPPLAQFWAEAAMDELQHFSILRFCREHKITPGVEPDVRSSQNIEQLLETVKSLVSGPNISVEEAFYASMLIESSELDEIYKRLTSGLEGDHPLLYQAIRANLQSHLRTFEEGAAQFCRDRGFVEALRNMGRSV
jgi:hypothetical protein